MTREVGLLFTPDRGLNIVSTIMRGTHLLSATVFYDPSTLREKVTVFQTLPHIGRLRICCKTLSTRRSSVIDGGKDERIPSN